MSAKETWSGSRPFSGNRNCSTRKDCGSTLQSSPARGMEFKPSPERERVGCSIRSNKRREVAIRRCGWSSEVQSPLGKIADYIGCADACALRHRRNRSEEHTSELQSHSDLVCRLLLEKK